MVTVTAAVTDSRASLTLPDDDDSVTDGVQVNLTVGANTVTVTVTAEDGYTTGAYTITVSRADETNPPQLTSATVDAADLTLVYSEALDAGSDPAAGDFAVTVVDSVTSVEAAVAVTAVDVDGSDVELTLATAVRHGDTVTFDYTPGTNPIKDAASNPAAALDDQAVTNNTANASDATLQALALADAAGTAVALSPVFGSPEDITSTYTAQVANEVAVVTVTATGADDRAAVVIAPADSDADTEHHQAALAAALTEASDTTVTVTVTAEDTTTTGTYTVTVTRAPDTTAPSLSTATVDGTELTLTYSEALDTASEPAVGAFSVSVTDSVTSTTATPAVSTVDVTGTEVTLTLGAAVRNNDTVTVSYTVPDEANNEAVIQDTAGLNAAALSSQSVTNATAKATDATLAALGLTAGGATLTLTPAFDATETSYSASVAFEVTAVTVTVIATTDSRAQLTLPADDDSVAGGLQVNLDVGDNAVTVTVIAEDTTTAAYTVTVSRADETDPPQLTTATINGTDLTLTYNEALDAGSEPAAGDFAVTVVDAATSAEAAVAVTAVDVDGSDVELTLAAAVRHGDTVTFDYTAATDPIKDLAANNAADLDDQAATNNTAAATDTTLDVLSLADAAGAAVALSPTFGSVQDTTSTYTASVANEVAVVTVTATGVDDRATVVIAPADADTDTEHHQAALAAALTEASDTTITVTITAEDTTTTGTYTITVTRAADTTAPSLSTATVNGADLLLAYSEALDTGSEPAVSAFSVSVTDSVTSATSTAAVTAVDVTGVEVTLTLGAAVRNGDTVTVSYVVPDEANSEAVIEDLAGLNAAALASQSVTNNTAKAADATLASLAVSAGETALTLTPAFDAVESTYSASVTFEVQVVTVTAAVTDSRAQVTLPTDDDSLTEGVQVNLDVGDNTVSVTVTAEDGSTTSAYTVTVSRADETDPPQLSTATVDGTDMTLTYSEALNTGSQPAAGDFAVSVTDSVTSAVSAVSVTAVDVDGTEVTLTLAAAVRSGDTVTVDYTPGTDPIQDAASNPAAGLDDQAVTNNTAKATDATLDVLSLADAGGTAVALSPVFGSVEDTTSTYTASVANEVAVVTVTATGADTRAGVVIAPADSDTDTAKHQVDLPAALGEASDTTVTVTVTAEDNSTTRTYTVTVTRAPDTTAPSLATATVDGTELTLAYSEALDADSEPAVSAFSVSVTDSVTSTASTPAVSDVDVTGTDVELTLAAAVRNGDTVTVSYTVPDEANSEAVIQDTATNNAAALSSQTVTNNTAKAADATLSALALAAGETTLTLTPAFEAAKTTYSAQVANEVAAVTVTAAVADSRASLALPADDDSVAGGVQVNLTVGANTVSVTVTAEDGSTTGAYTVTVSRAAKPQLDTATVDGASLVLGYDKTLDESSEPAVSDFVVSVTDSVTSVEAAAAVATVDIAAAAVTLTLSTPVRFGDTVTVTYTPGTSPVQVGAGTLADALSNHTVANNTAGATDTTLSQLGLSYGEDAVTLTPVFAADRTTYSASVGYDATVVTVYATTTDVRASWEATDDDTETGGYQVDLDVGDTTVTVTVTPEDGETTGTYTITVTRAAKPQLDTATANGASLVLSYDKTLDEDSLPAGSDFAVSVTDSVTGVEAAATVAQVDVAAATVTLTLSTPVRFGDTVTVTYTPGDDPIQVGAGTLAAALASHTVTNNTTKATDVTLSALAVAAGGAALALSPAFEAAKTSYSAQVANEVTQVTVTAAVADSRASVTLPTDDDTVTDGVQIDLAAALAEASDTTITVTVTAEDSTTTATYTITVTRAADTTAPQLSSATVNGTQLTLTYSEALDGDSVPDKAAFGVTVDDSSTAAADPVAVAVDAVAISDVEMTLTLGAAVRHDDTVTVTYTVPDETNNEKAIQDTAGLNAAALASEAVTNNTATASDATLDVLTLAEPDGTAVTLTPAFGSAEDTTGTYTASVANEVASVTVTATGADTRAAVVISPADSDTDTDHHQVDLAAALSEASDTTVTVTVTAEDGSTTGTYTVTVSRAADTTAPQLSSATVDGTQLTLTYSEALDSDSEPAVGAFAVSVTDSVTSATATPTVSSVNIDGADVELTLAAAVRHGDTVTVTYTVPDEANNEKAIQDTAGLNAAALASEAVTNTTATASDATLDVLMLAEPDGTAVALSPGFGSTEDTSDTYTASVVHEVASVTVTATGADTRAGVVISPTDADIDTEHHQVELTPGVDTTTTAITVTVTAEDGTTATYTITVTRAADTTAPSLASATADGTALVLAYDETLDGDSVPDKAAFSVTVDDSATAAADPVAVAVDAVAISGVEVTLTLGTAVRHDDTVTVSYTVPDETNNEAVIQDTAGLNAAALSSQAVTNNTATATNATLASVGLIGQDLTQLPQDILVAVTNSVYEAGVLTARVTVVARPADPRAVVTITPTDADSQTAEHEVDLVGGDNTITVTVTAEDAATTFTHTILVTRLVDNTPPALATATIDGTELVLNYDEALNEGSEPAPGAFSVSVVDAVTDDASTPAISGVSFETSQVKLTLAAAVRHDDAVTITYTQPSQNKLQDIFGNNAAALSAQTVTNNTAAASDTTLSALGLSEVELWPPVFAPDTVVYSAAVANSVSVATIGTVTTTDPRATVAISPDDADTETSDHQVELTAGAATTITATVTAEDGTTGAYEIIVSRAAGTEEPTLVSAAVDGTALTLVYDSALDTGSRPVPADFTVRVVDSVTGASLAPEATAVFVGGREVGLTLESAVRFRDTVTVSYTAGTDPIQDTAANPAQSFNARPVTNTTAKASDATLERLTVPGFDVSPQFSADITMYSLSVHDIAAVTVVAVAADERASVAVVPADTDSIALGNQIPLRDGQNTITVTVTAEDGTTTNSTYTVNVTRTPIDLDTVTVRTIDWTEFDAGVPTHTLAQSVKDWLVTTLKYALTTWWSSYRNLEQSGTYLDFVSSTTETSDQHRYREPSNMALALAVALSTGVYDASVTGVTESTARDRALKLIRSMAYRHDINAPPSSQSSGRWGYNWQPSMWAAHAGLAGWLLWDYLSDSDKLLVKKMIVAEANEYHNPLYYRNRSEKIRFSGDSKSEEMAWNSYVIWLAAVMMPDHPDADMWRTSSIHLALATYSRPEDASSSEVIHGHALSEWLIGSNINSNSTVTNHGLIHPDYMASGVEFNPALIYFMAGLPTPEAGRFNVARVMEAFVELEFTPGGDIEEPGGTILRAGTLCEGNDSEVASCKADEERSGQTFEAGHDRGCLAGPPGTDTNVYYPEGSSWSKKRRPNLAMFVAQADVFGFDSLVDDSTLHADYWSGCYVRDVRAMQARHSNGRTWEDEEELRYQGREGQSAHYASKAWLAYWIGHQAGNAGVTYENNDNPLEFNRIATIEAEASTNTLHGSAATETCLACSNRSSVKLAGSGTANALTVTGVNAPAAGRYPLYVVYWSEQDRDVTVTVSGGPPYGGGSYDLSPSQDSPRP